MIDIDLPIFDDMFHLDVPNFDNIVSQCKYYTIPTERPNIKDKFSIIHLNARSIKNKFDDIQNLLAASGVDWSVICISETWLKTHQLPSYFIDGYNVFASCRENGEGGGSLMYVNKHYNVKERRDLESKHIETTFVELSIPCANNKSIIIGNIYRPPTFSHVLFHEYIAKLLDTLEGENKTVIIGGDFNYDLLNVKCDQHAHNFNSLLSSYNFFLLFLNPPEYKMQNSHFYTTFI